MVLPSFLVSQAQAEDDVEDDDVIVYDHSNIEFKHDFYFNSFNSSLPRNGEPADMESFLLSATPKPMRSQGSAIDKCITTMDQAVQVPKALECPGRRTMFDVLAQLKGERKDENMEKRVRIALACDNKFEHNISEPESVARENRQEQSQLQENCSTTLGADISDMVKEAAESKLQRGLKHLLPKHLQKSDKTHITPRASEEKRSFEEEYPTSLDISDFSSISSVAERNDPVDSCSPLSISHYKNSEAHHRIFKRFNTPTAHQGSHTTTERKDKHRRLSVLSLISLENARVTDRYNPDTPHRKSSKSQDEDRLIVLPTPSVATRSIWDVFQDHERMAARKTHPNFKRPSTRLTRLNTDPFLGVQSPLTRSTIALSTSQISGTFGTFLDNFLSNDILGDRASIEDSAEISSHRQESQKHRWSEPTMQIKKAENIAGLVDEDSKNTLSGGRCGLIGKPMLFMHSLSSNVTGNISEADLPLRSTSTQISGELDKRALRQLSRIPTALRVVNYLRCTFNTWTVNGALLEECWHRRTEQKVITGSALDTLSSLSPRPTPSLARSDMKCNETQPSRPEELSFFTKPLNNTFDSISIFRHNTIDQTTSLIEKGLKESGIHVAFTILSINVSYGLICVLAELDWVHPSLATKLGTSAFLSQNSMTNAAISMSIFPTDFPVKSPVESLAGVNRAPDLGPRRWMLVFPETVRCAVPLVVGHSLYLAQPFFVYSDICCILGAYNVTSDILIRKHCSAEKVVLTLQSSSPQKRVRYSRTKLCPTRVVADSARQYMLTEVDPRSESEMSQNKGAVNTFPSFFRQPRVIDTVPTNLGVGVSDHASVTHWKDLYDPLTSSIFDNTKVSESSPAGPSKAYKVESSMHESQQADRRSQSANIADCDSLGSGFPRGPGTEWDVPIQVLRVFASASRLNKSQS